MSNKTRIAKICVDIGESTVKIVRISSKGKIVRAGIATMTPLPDDSSVNARIGNLSAAIKTAAENARISRGNCILVTGGSHVIVRRFLWPDLPQDALMTNAESEIRPYLPGEQFEISCRILGRNVTTSQEAGNQVTRLDVLVAAIEKSMVDILRAASKKAGFKVKRIDIRENAREKLTSNEELWSSYRLRSGQLGGERNESSFVPTGSFVILDLTDSLVNMTVFVKGMFYANRYFSANLGVRLSEEQTAESGDADSAEREFAYNLATEAASVIDYVHYQERGSEVRSVLFLGDRRVAAGFKESLAENLDIPVISDSEVFNKILLSRKLIKLGKTDSTNFLDAYGAAHIVGSKHDRDLDLRNKRHEKKVSKWLIPALAGSLLVLGALAYAGIYIPQTKVTKLEAEVDRLSGELSKFSVSEVELQSLKLEVENMNKMTEELLAFYSSYPPVSEVLQSVYGSLPSGTGLNDVTILDGTVNVRGTAASLGTVARYIDRLRLDGMFDNDITHSAGNIPRGGESSRLGFSVKSIETTYEDGAVDFELTLHVAGTPEATE